MGALHEGIVVDGFGDKRAVAGQGECNSLTSATGEVREAGAVEERMTNRMERVGIKLAGVEAATQHMLEECSFETRRVTGDPGRELGNGIVGGGEQELFRVVGENAVRDGGMLREHIGERSEVVVTQTLEQRIDISTLTKLQILELGCESALRGGSEREERRRRKRELHRERRMLLSAEISGWAKGELETGKDRILGWKE